MMVKKFLPFLLIFLFVFLIFLTNFTPGTWLSGWDNLHPEFDFDLNIKRSLFAVWQEYQGLGLLGGMGHASDLVRQIILWFFSLLIPVSLLRYFYHFSMLFLGAFGVFFFLKNFLLENFTEDHKKISSLGGVIFYLFNLATIQMFYVPFEAYSAHFAALPWLFWANLNFLKTGNRKSLIWLTILNLLFLTQGYVATFFVVYLSALSLVCLFWFFQQRNSLKRILLIALLVFSLNAFWLLPNLYFLATSTQINIQAKINQMSTEDVLLKNKKYGTLTDTALLRGFWFDNVEIDETGRANYQLKLWREHLQKPYVAALGYFLFALSFVGILLALIKKEKRILLFLPVFLLAFLFLSNDTPIFSPLASLFYKIPLLKQIFRFPYTKFAILAAFCLALFYAYFTTLLMKLIRKSVFKWVICFAVFFLPVIYLFPVFQGHLFYKKEMVKIPEEYFQVMDFFKSQDKNTRIVNFPQTTFWGWTFYRWNYSGSGFLWYGIKQPIIDRAFDPWSNKNENYYWEISYALYSQNLELFEKVLEKYQINWLLVDGNVLNPPSAKALYLDELEEMLSSSKKIFLAQEFGKIKIYQVNLKTPVKDFVFLAQNLPVVEPEYKWNNHDKAYLENGDYLTNCQLPITNYQTYYPFRSLFTGKTQEDFEFAVEERDDWLVFKKALPKNLENHVLEIPKIKEEELIWVDPNNLGQIRYLKPEVRFDGKVIEVIVPKIGGYFSTQIESSRDPEVQTAKNCNPFSKGTVKNEIIEENGKKFLRLTAIDAKNCSPSFWLPNLPHKYAYLITVESRHIGGKSLLFWLENPNSRKADMETYLPKKSNLTTSYFLQPPMEGDGLGYAFHFDNISIGRDKTVNDLGKITVNLIPYHLLAGIKVVKNQEVGETPKLFSPSKVYHPNPSYYKITINNLTIEQSSNLTLVLSQSFHPGWQAFLVRGRAIQPIKSHVLVNNWANGWMLDQSSVINHQLSIILVFLPQFLEYFGFFLLLVLGCVSAYFLLK